MAPTTSDPTASGGVYCGVRDWTLTRHGPAARERVAKLLSEEARNWFENTSLVSTSRVPAAAFRELGTAMIKNFGLTGEGNFLECTGDVAIADLSSIMRVLMRVGTPGFVLARFPRVWKHYFSHGALEVTENGPRDCRVAIVDAEMYGDTALIGAIGWMRAALKYAGAKGPDVTHLRERPGLHRYRVSWQRG